MSLLEEVLAQKATDVCKFVEALVAITEQEIAFRRLLLQNAVFHLWGMSDNHLLAKSGKYWFSINIVGLDNVGWSVSVGNDGEDREMVLAAEDCHTFAEAAVVYVDSLTAVEVNIYYRNCGSTDRFSFQQHCWSWAEADKILSGSTIWQPEVSGECTEHSGLVAYEVGSEMDIHAQTFAV